MKKNKPTHGICRSCNTEFELLYFNGIVKSRLCIKCLYEKVYDNRKKQEKTELKKEHKDDTISQNHLQIEINRLVKMIDFGHTCICTNKHEKEINAGHYYSVGSDNSLRFNLHNIFIQCKKSNNNHNEDINNYRNGLIETFGENYYNYVVGLKKSYPYIKITKTELKEKTKLVRALIKGYKPYKLTNKQRIIERNKYNAIIGIYGVNYDFES